MHSWLKLQRCTCWMCNAIWHQLCSCLQWTQQLLPYSSINLLDAGMYWCDDHGVHRRLLTILTYDTLVVVSSDKLLIQSRSGQTGLELLWSYLWPWLVVVCLHLIPSVCNTVRHAVLTNDIKRSFRLMPCHRVCVSVWLLTCSASDLHGVNAVTAECPTNLFCLYVFLAKIGSCVVIVVAWSNHYICLHAQQHSQPWILYCGISTD